MAHSDTDYVFFGSPGFAVSVLAELERAGMLPGLVVTAPDKKRGRGQKTKPTPVKRWAQNRNIPTLTPESINERFIRGLPEKSPKKSSWSMYLVVAYGKILPGELIYQPEHHTLNLHPSLLPRVRGAAPIRGAILEEDKTGVTIIELDEKMDHGPIVAQKEVPTQTWPAYYNQLKPKLAQAGGTLLADTIPKWVADDIKATPQDHNKASYVGKFSSDDGRIEFADPAEQNLRKIRAFTDWPKAHFYHEDMRVIITNAHTEDDELIIDRVKPAGHSAMSFEKFKKEFH